jgi:hypothetical protein
MNTTILPLDTVISSLPLGSAWCGSNPNVDRSGPPQLPKTKTAKKKAPSKKPGKKAVRAQ